MSKAEDGAIFETAAAAYSAVTTMRHAGERPAAKAATLSSAALKVAREPYERAYSPIVLAGLVRVIEVSLVVLIGFAVYVSYVMPANGFAWHYVGAVFGIALLAMLALPHDGVSPVGIESIRQVASADDLAEARRTVTAVAVEEPVAKYIVDLVRRTRELPSVVLGASPRAANHLMAASRAIAALNGRGFVTPDDVADLAPSVLAHRLVLTPDAELESFTAHDAIRVALGDVSVPR